MNSQTYIFTPLEKEIKALYEFLGILTPGDINMFSIAKKLNIWLSLIDFQNLVFRSLPSGLYIFINKDESRAKQWLNFGFELCHLLHHYRQQLNLPGPLAELQKTNAKKFALHFCIPTFMLLRLTFPTSEKKSIALISKTFHVPTHFARQRYELFEREMAGSQFYKALNKKNWTDEKDVLLKKVCQKYDVNFNLHAYEQLTDEQKLKLISRLKSRFDHNDGCN